VLALISRDLVSIDVHQAMNNRLKIFSLDRVDLAIAIFYDLYRPICYCISRCPVVPLKDNWV
jgi:hypothetical protein